MSKFKESKNIKIKSITKIQRGLAMLLAAFLLINITTIEVVIPVNAEEITNVPVSELDMGDYSDTMKVGEKQLLTVTVLPMDATEQTVSYTSSNKSVATVNGMGRITALAVGTTTIKATCQDKSASFTLNVTESSSTDVKVTDLDLGDYQSTMEIGSTQLLSVTPLPTTVTDATVTYASSDEKIASVNSLGRITANKIGKATITISCGQASSSIKITVTEKSDDTVAVTDLEIANHEDQVKVDETLSLTATVIPSNATDTTVTYKSSNKKIATVNSSGEVKGISVGNVTITISAGKIVKKVKLEVVVSTKAITMNTDYLVLKPGETFTLSGSVAPSDAVQSLTYKSSNQSVASVSASGLVTANAVGEASIIVSNGDMQAAVTVIVNSSDQITDNNDIDDTESPNSDMTAAYEDSVLASEVAKIDSERLKALYEDKTSLLIDGDGYSILLNGADIVNYYNELDTDIKLEDYHKVKNANDIEGITFEINDSNPICGNIVLYLDNADGNFLYLYNESKEEYELIDASDFSEINISSPGKYLITKSKIRQSNWFVIMFSAIGVIGLLIGTGIYIGIRKRYWFW